MTARIRVLVLASVALSSALCGADDNTVLARAAIQGYTQHLDTFTQFSCRWERYGRTPRPQTLAECMTDGPMGRKRVANFFQDGDLWVYKEEGEPSPLRLPSPPPSGKKDPPPVWGTKDPVNRYAGDTNLIFSHEAGHGQALLYEDDVYHKQRHQLSSDIRSPLHRVGFREVMPEYNVAVQVKEAERAGRKWTVSGRGVVNGVECVAVTVDTERTGCRSVFHLALQRGFLPYRIEMFEPGEKGEQFYRQDDILEVKDCGSGKFFPTFTRHILRQSQGESGHNFVCAHTRTLSVEVGQPKRDDMTIEVPGDVIIYRMDVEGAPMVPTKQTEKVRADQLGYLVELSEKRREKPYTDTALTPPPSNWPWYVGGGVAVLAFSAVGVWAWRRARSRRAQP